MTFEESIENLKNNFRNLFKIKNKESLNNEKDIKKLIRI